MQEHLWDVPASSEKKANRIGSNACPTHPLNRSWSATQTCSINFALGGGAGIKRGDVVRIAAHEAAKPLYVELHRAVWRAGAHAIGHYAPDDDGAFNLSRDFYELAATSRSTSSRRPTCAASSTRWIIR